MNFKNAQIVYNTAIFIYKNIFLIEIRHQAINALSLDVFQKFWPRVAKSLCEYYCM